MSGAYTYDIDWIPEASFTLEIRDTPTGDWIAAGSFDDVAIAASTDWGLVLGVQPLAGAFADARFRVSVRVVQTITPPGGAPAPASGDIPDPPAAHRDLALTITRIA